MVKQSDSAADKVVGGVLGCIGHAAYAVAVTICWLIGFWAVYVSATDAWGIFLYIGSGGSLLRISWCRLRLWNRWYVIGWMKLEPDGENGFFHLWRSLMCLHTQMWFFS